MTWTLPMIQKKGEANMCLMKKHKDNEANDLTSYFMYRKLFLICEKVYKMSRSKLKEIISLSK